ncbi:hypothetical protein DFH07DRAFT_845684 [Mycena maculata]|uniref:Secreted protein n=1 Tax=Mycena maculata TaxID=230809 RepID=A0AAD7I361_9AGAR|nr:hypothetical protein DFH07DRAFT_845684 [Mycena maculata]
MGLAISTWTALCASLGVVAFAVGHTDWRSVPPAPREVNGRSSATCDQGKVARKRRCFEVFARNIRDWIPWYEHYKRTVGVTTPGFEGGDTGEDDTLLDELLNSTTDPKLLRDEILNIYCSLEERLLEYATRA